MPAAAQAAINSFPQAMNYPVGDLAKQNGQYVRVTGVNKDGTLQVRPLTSTEIADAGLAAAHTTQDCCRARDQSGAGCGLDRGRREAQEIG
jgi:hypothetical protein